MIPTLPTLAAASVIDWIVLPLVGGMFLIFGIVKLAGLARGIVGGGDKPLAQRLCGT